MKTLAAGLAIAASLSLPAAADDTQQSVKSGLKKAQRQTDDSLDKARKSGKKGLKKTQKAADDAAKAFRQKLGTEK